MIMYVSNLTLEVVLKQKTVNCKCEEKTILSAK